MSIGSTLKSCRKLRKLTQAALSDKTDLSESYISLIEKGKREPSISNLELIANALDIPLSLIILLSTSQMDNKELSTDLLDELTKTIYSLINES